MSTYRTPEEHAANPPSTWTVTKRCERLWAITDRAGTVFDTFPTKKAATAALVDGFSARLWAKESRWYAGEPVAGWKPYATIVAEREALAAWLAKKALAS